MKTPLLLSALLLLATVPTALAAGPGPSVQTTCLPLSQAVQCVVNLVVGVVTGAGALVICILSVAPGDYPDGLSVCTAPFIQVLAP